MKKEGNADLSEVYSTRSRVNLFNEVNKNGEVVDFATFSKIFQTLKELSATSIVEVDDFGEFTSWIKTRNYNITGGRLPAGSPPNKGVSIKARTEFYMDKTFKKYLEKVFDLKKEKK